MAKQHVFHGRKALEKRQREADERQALRDTRTNEEQILLLGKRPGDSAREVVRLMRS